MIDTEAAHAATAAGARPLELPQCGNGKATNHVFIQAQAATVDPKKRKHIHSVVALCALIMPLS